MVLAEKIQQYIQRLPAALQQEALDFVEYLLTKVERKAVLREDREWAYLSLSSAMCGMEDEETPVYVTADVKEAFS